MKSQEIQQALLRWYYPKGRKIANTNFTGAGLHECDVIMLTGAGMIYEYEVKCSLSDFKADFKKEHKHERMRNKGLAKGDQWLLEKGYNTCPNYFYYASEENLLSESLIPEYAGLVYIVGQEVRVIKKAPKIHSRPATDKLKDALIQSLSAKLIYGCSYMNWQNKQK